MSYGLTEADIKAHQAKHGSNASVKPAKPVARPVPSAKASMQQLGRLKTGQMNKTEARYNEKLDWMRNAGEILWHKFEGMKFRLADNTFYTPDFAVMNASGEIELHEVKGKWEEDARVKIKVAASLYPMKFVAIKAKTKREGGGWSYEWF